MIEVLASVLGVVVVGLVWLIMKIMDGAPTHEEKVEKGKQASATERLQHANALLVELKIMDALMPMLPKEFKDKLSKYLGGSDEVV